MKKIVGSTITGVGVILFAFGFYILPFGTDIYLHFWVVNIFHGNWLYGSLAGNAFALILIAIGLLLMRENKEVTEKTEKKFLPIKKKPKKEGDRWLRL